MTEKNLITPEAAKQAAENISQALTQVPESPVNPEYFLTNFDLIFTDYEIWQTFKSLIYLLNKDYAGLTNKLEINVDLVILNAYLDLLGLDLIEQMKTVELEKEIVGYRSMLAPVVESLILADRNDIAIKILEALDQLLDSPFKAITDLYEQLQLVKELKVIIGQPDVANFETIYEIVEKLFNWALDANLNHKEWQHQPKEA